jgi:glutaredoxin 3
MGSESSTMRSTSAASASAAAADGSADSSPRKVVAAALAENPVIVFSKTYCPYCDKAKAALRAEGARFRVIELDERRDGDVIQAELARLTGRRTVPNVFIAGASIGGGDDTAALQRSGALRAMLCKAKAVDC